MVRTHRAEIDLSGVTRLPLRVRPEKFETAISLLNRQAVRSGYDGYSQLLASVPGLPRRIEFSMAELAAIAARVNGTYSEALSASRVDQFSASWKPESINYVPNPYAVRGRVCVGCLREDFFNAPPEIRPWAPFLRDWWQVAQISSCPFHLMPLIGKCADCDQKLSVRRPYAVQCSCGANLLKMNIDPIASVEITADAYLLGRLGRVRKREVPILDDLSFATAAGLMLNLGLSLQGVELKPSVGTGCDRTRYASRGLEALAGGINGYEAALSDIHSKYTKPWKPGSLAGRYGHLQRWLTFCKEDELSIFREALLSHAKRHGAVTQSTTIFGSKVKGGEWMTMDQLSLSIGRSIATIHRMLIALGLEKQATGGKPTDLIAVKVVPRLKREFVNSIGLREACEIIGCSRHQLNIYICNGKLRECFRAVGERHYLKRKDVVNFISQATGSSADVRQVPSTLFTLTEANRTRLRLGAEWVTLAMLDGKLKPQGVFVGQDGVRALRNVLVSRDEVAELWRNVKAILPL